VTIRNPSFGVYPTDDDHGDFGHGVIDPRVNVEKQVVDLLAKGIEARGPQTSSVIELRNDCNMNCTVITYQGGKKTVWQSPPGPCITMDKYSSLYNWLCDGRIPICEEFHPGDKDYDPTGCRNFRKCLGKWTKMTMHEQKKASPGFYPG